MLLFSKDFETLIINWVWFSHAGIPDWLGYCFIWCSGQTEINRFRIWCCGAQETSWMTIRTLVLAIIFPLCIQLYVMDVDVLWWCILMIYCINRYIFFCLSKDLFCIYYILFRCDVRFCCWFSVSSSSTSSSLTQMVRFSGSGKSGRYSGIRA